MLRGVRLLRWIAVAGIALLALLFAVGVAARFSDGPIAIFPGGPLRAGEWVSEPVRNWSFAADVAEIELQLVEPPRSRTVWILVHEGRAYVPCGFLDVPLWKQWPHEALADGRAVARIEGRRYPLRAVRITEPELYARLGERAAEKYGAPGGTPDPDAVWFFRLDPRPPTPQEPR